MRTRYGPSFLSMYRAAASMVHFIRSQFDKKAIFFARCWPILAQALHATVILGSVAACGTASSLAPQAFIHFSLGYEMFRKAPMHPVINALVVRALRIRFVVIADHTLLTCVANCDSAARTGIGSARKTRARCIVQILLDSFGSRKQENPQPGLSWR